MSFIDKFGVTKIVDEKRDNLSLSFDSGCRRIKDGEVGLVFLFTPDMSETSSHYHIELNKDEIINLKNWIDSFLEEPSMLERYKNDLKKISKVF
jgi:hypothetical protein